MPQDSKKVFIDFRMCRSAGIGRYIQETLRGILKSNRYRFVLLGRASDESLARVLADGQPFEYRTANSEIYSIAEQTEIARLAKDADLFHAPHFNVPVFLRTKLVVTLHDLIYLKEHSYKKNWLRAFYVRHLLHHISQKASGVLTVSEYTKRDLQDAFPEMRASQITVTPEAASTSFGAIRDLSTLEAFKKAKKIENPFCLYVGSLKSHKNIPALVQALKRCRDRYGLKHEIVLIGRPDKKDTQLLSSLRQESFVRYEGEAADEELVYWYNLAEVFVLPSFMEGFGLPVLEAMACETPVILSNQTSLPEVGGDGALYFDPTARDSIDALSEVLYNVLSDKNLQQKMIRKGLEQAQKFTWQKTADLTLNCYGRIFNESSSLA